MAVYAWGTVFAGETILWTTTAHETITFSGGTVLENPNMLNANDVQTVVIGDEEYDFGVDVALWTALWDWAVAVADNADAAANTLEAERIVTDLAGFVLE